MILSQNTGVIEIGALFIIMTYNKFLFFTCFTVLAAPLQIFALSLKSNSMLLSELNHTNFSINTLFNNDLSNDVEEINRTLLKLLLEGNYDDCKPVVERIIELDQLNGDLIADSTIAKSYYYVGVFYMLTDKINNAIKYLSLCAEIKRRDNIKDELFTKALYNLGLLFDQTGDYAKQKDYSLQSLEVEKKLYGNESYMLIDSYSSLISAYTQLQEYEKAIYYSNIALAIGNNNPDMVSMSLMADIYNNLGVCYTRIADYTKANVFLEKAESIYIENNLANNDNFINLLNNRAVTFGALGRSEKSAEYYEKGISYAISGNSSNDFNLINSYAIILGNNGKLLKGKELLEGALKRAEDKFGAESRNYIEVLKNNADYLREYMKDTTKALNLYTNCMKYLETDQYDIFTTSVIVGYSLALADNGQEQKALNTIDTLLNSGNGSMLGVKPFESDSNRHTTIKADRNSLKILKAKYDILMKISQSKNELGSIEIAAVTAELIIGLLEQVRINISEDDSRIVLGDKYRDMYFNIISNFNQLYSQTGSRKFLDKIFEYTEKSKVAGLLASTRELKASQFHIPQDLVTIENNIKRDINLYDSKITQESERENPDSILISDLNENLFRVTRLKDSLILVFEKKYPAYYSIKYNTDVIDLKDIPQIIGRNGNYINYIVADDIIYAFVANRKMQELVAIPVDTTFLNSINNFRILLSTNSTGDNARESFDKFTSIGYNLYHKLVEPLRAYLISDEILISPDNILSYIPFETLLTNDHNDGRLMYRDLPYLMNELNISYTYSATFLAESSRSSFSPGNKLVAFAPDYSEPIEIQSILNSRDVSESMLYDLPFARQEAEYVAQRTKGTLYVNDAAIEGTYKSESAKYDIIHLAMHAVLNDDYPMNSTLIFSQVNDSIEDNYLKTYEIYGLPLKAKMVVLSSCNTGSGYLSGGEGILSLARGFIYSGSQSIVMAMWEIDDKSGTEVVKMFYDNLKKGMSKSSSIKQARISYLKKADQLRSHPYFWSTLVIYGNNDPLYLPTYLIILAILIPFAIAAVLIRFYRKRIYSR